MTQRVELENSDDNLCFGCGPQNPIGLRLRFFMEGDRVITECVPTKWWSGQPGVVNPGIAYAVLVDLIIWTAGGILHRVPLMPKTIQMNLGDMSTKRLISGIGRIVKREGPMTQIRAELKQDGVVKALLEIETKSVSRAEYQKARPMVEIPESLAGYFEGES
jgi:hypothetical protein